jgi:hypothetical protein
VRLSPCRGQNQNVAVIATGSEAHTTAHGVKIEPMKNTVVASAVMNGHGDGDGISMR